LDNARSHNSGSELNLSAVQKHLITVPAIFVGCSAIQPLSFWNASRKAQKLCRENNDELKQGADSIPRSIPEPELFSVFQTWPRRSQQIIDSSGKYI
jgi:hypothetical protein